MLIKKKRGRPATGRSQGRKHLNYQIAACFDALREQGVPEEDAINELMGREWQVIPGPIRPIILGEESVRATIKESRKFGITADMFSYSSRLKIHPFWGKLFERDDAGKIQPASTNRLLVEAIKNCRSIRKVNLNPHLKK